MVKIGRYKNLRCIVAINLNSNPLKTLSFCLKEHEDVLFVC